MSKQTNASVYEQAEAYIFNIPKFTTKNGLEHTREALKKLGNPAMDKRMIHVAGTNGKGSVCAYLDAMLRQQGLKVGLFTSPHLVSMCERIQIDGKPVSEETFGYAFQTVLKMVEESVDEIFAHPTFFEFLFLMAAVTFKEQNVDVIIWETGLGGRLDATNVIRPELCVITEIGLDHMAYLGNTISEIAAEKAGIIKENVPVITIDRKKDASDVICEKARKIGAPCTLLKKDGYFVKKSGHKHIDFLFRSSYYNKEICLTMPFLAPYQCENAYLALTAYELFMKKPVTKAQLACIGQVKWPCRFEEILPGIIVDGAHNEDGIEAFLEAVAHDGVKGMRSIVFGAVSDKAYMRMLSMILDSGLFGRIMLTGMENERAVAAMEYRSIFEKRGEEMPMRFEDAEAAFAYAKQFAKGEDVVYIVGSLYLAGYIKKALLE